MCISKHQSGISLIELIMFIVIVSIALAGVINVLNLNTSHSADPVVRKQAMAIAESLLEEIEEKNFAKPAGGFAGPFTPVNRQLFDTVSDYSVFSMSPVADITNTAIPSLTGYSASVTETPVTLCAGAVCTLAGDALLITVRVDGPGGFSVTLDGYRTNI